MTRLAIDYEELMSVTARSVWPNAIRKLTVLLGSADLVSFAAGAPSPDTFPAAELAEIAAQVIATRGASVLQYGPTRGTAPLVEAIIADLAERGIEGVAPSEVI